MTEKTFNKGFKLFKRFLKEENLYIPVLKFIFQHNRPKQNLFEEFNSKVYTNVGDWEYIFDRTNLLTGYLWEFDFEEFTNLILKNDLPTKWKKYYNKRRNK